jgi:hypothetical protein
MLGAPENSHYQEEQRIERNKQAIKDLWFDAILALLFSLVIIWVMMEGVK